MNPNCLFVIAAHIGQPVQFLAEDERIQHYAVADEAQFVLV